MSRLDNIEQAKMPIYQFKGIGNKSNQYISGEEAIYSQNTKRMYPDGYPVADMELQNHSVFGPGLNDMVHILNQFNNANSDNPYALNPINPDGTYDDARFVPVAYNINLALSHWDELKSKYGIELDNMSNKVQESASNSDKYAYESAALTLGSHAYLGECAGLDENQVKYMIKHTEYKDGYINERQLGDTSFVLQSELPDDVKINILEQANSNTLHIIADNINNPNVDANDLALISNSKDSRVARMIMDDISDDIINHHEAKDCVASMNLMHDYLIKHQEPTDVLQDIYCDVRRILYNERKDIASKLSHNPDANLTGNQKDGVILGDNKLYNLMGAYITSMNNTIDFSKTLFEFKDKPMDAYADSKSKYEDIKIPLGLVDGPRDGKYGKYDIISVPFEGKFGKMIVSDSLVTRDNKTAILSLDANKSKTVKFYDKESKTDMQQDFSVSELKDIYVKNWQRLNARNKNLDSKFDFAGLSDTSVEYN